MPIKLHGTIAINVRSHPVREKAVNQSMTGRLQSKHGDVADFFKDELLCSKRKSDIQTQHKRYKNMPNKEGRSNDSKQVIFLLINTLCFFELIQSPKLHFYKSISSCVKLFHQMLIFVEEQRWWTVRFQYSMFTNMNFFLAWTFCWRYGGDTDDLCHDAHVKPM